MYTLNGLFYSYQEDDSFARDTGQFLFVLEYGQRGDHRNNECRNFETWRYFTAKKSISRREWSRQKPCKCGNNIFHCCLCKKTCSEFIFVQIEHELERLDEQMIYLRNKIPIISAENERLLTEKRILEPKNIRHCREEFDLSSKIQQLELQIVSESEMETALRYMWYRRMCVFLKSFKFSLYWLRDSQWHAQAYAAAERDWRSQTGNCSGQSRFGREEETARTLHKENWIYTAEWAWIGRRLPIARVQTEQKS